MLKVFDFQSRCSGFELRGTDFLLTNSVNNLGPTVGSRQVARLNLLTCVITINKLSKKQPQVFTESEQHTTVPFINDVIQIWTFSNPPQSVTHLYHKKTNPTPTFMRDVFY